MRYSFQKGNWSLLNSLSLAKRCSLTTQFNDTFLFPFIFILLFYSLLYHEDLIFSLLNQWKNTYWTEWIREWAALLTNRSINSDLPLTGKPLTTCCMITEREIIALVNAAKAKVFCDVPFKKLHMKMNTTNSKNSMHIFWWFNSLLSFHLRGNPVGTLLQFLNGLSPAIQNF